MKRRDWIGLAVVVGAELAGERALLHVDFTSALASGREGQLAAVALAVLFVALRIVVLLGVPALLVTYAGLALFDRAVKR